MDKKVKISIGILVFLIIATVGCIWLSGAIFLGINKINPLENGHFNTWFEYYNYYHLTDKAVDKKLKIALLLAVFICYGLPLILLAVALSNRNKRELHGSARFANNNEIKKTGLMTDKKGILIGQHQGKYLNFVGQQFVLLSAPTRGGKGVSTVIPNLLNFQDSAVVLDIKQENYNITSGYRKKYGQAIYLFNPFTEDNRTDRYNPLDYVREGVFMVGDLTSIGQIFYPTGGKDAFFDDQARNLFVGIGLYLFETPHLPKTIGEMLRQSSGKGKPIKEYLEGIIRERNFTATTDEEGEVTYEPKKWDGEGLPPLSSSCIDHLNRFTGTSDNTRSSILASFNAPLGIFANPIVDAATSYSDFDLNDVRKKRMTIYIGITPNRLSEASRLVNLLFSQLINLNTAELPENNPALKYQCLLIMDEFTAIGQVEIIGKAVSYIAGYNLRLLTIIQAPSQLESETPKGYGKEGARTLVTNHACQILFTPREQKDAQEYSEMLGYETIKSKSTSKQFSTKGSRSESVSDQKRALMLPQELKELDAWKEIILLEKSKPILCDKIKYFEDATFMNRLKEVSPTLAQAKGIPPRQSLEKALQLNELSAPCRIINVDLNVAKNEKRVRPTTLEDVQQGIDLDSIVMDEITVPEHDISQQEANDIVDSIFSMMNQAQEDFNMQSEDSNETTQNNYEDHPDMVFLDEEDEDIHGVNEPRPNFDELAQEEPVYIEDDDIHGQNKPSPNFDELAQEEPVYIEDGDIHGENEPRPNFDELAQEEPIYIEDEDIHGVNEPRPNFDELVKEQSTKTKTSLANKIINLET